MQIKVLQNTSSLDGIIGLWIMDQLTHLSQRDIALKLGPTRAGLC